MKARYLFHNGTIYPVARSPVRAGALLTEGERIAWLGPEAELPIRDARGAEPIDLRGGALFPGFWDSHLHLLLSVEKSGQLDLLPLHDLDSLARSLADFLPTLAPGAWLVGHGWDRATLFPAGLPPADWLDARVAGRPAFLLARDAHSAWLNQAALAHLENMSGPPGGWQVHRTDGEPSGLVFEDVLALQARLVPPLSGEEKKRRLPVLSRELFRQGITAVVSNENIDDARLYREYLQAGGPGPRAVWNFCFSAPPLPAEFAATRELALSGFLASGGLKLFLDGSLGSRTAALDSPYRGTDDRGILVLEPPVLSRWLDAMDRLGIHGVFHTIGDRSTRLLLEALGRGPAGGKRRGGALPHHLEHVQFLSPTILRDYDLSGLVFNMQPSHMWHDRSLGARFLPEEIFTAGSYLLATLARAGTLCLGSDSPVESLDPWKGIEAATSRLDGRENTPGPWIGSESISLAAAIIAHTLMPALAQGDPFKNGRLEAGRPADLVVYPEDPFPWGKAHGHRYWGAMQPRLTLLAGEIVWGN